ncbi:MAG: hypothetical protein LBL61_05195 [Elusimicrobiota bacterium]|jgi:hypothetical protein|nr:hypothetical protein [Elusimicrobiota bacterium]
MNKRIGKDMYFYDDNNIFAFGSPYIKLAPEFIEVKGFPQMKWERITGVYIKELMPDFSFSSLFLMDSRAVRRQEQIFGGDRPIIDKIVVFKSDSGGEIIIKTSRLPANDVEVLNQEILSRLPYPVRKNFAGFY